MSSMGDSWGWGRGWGPGRCILSSSRGWGRGMCRGRISRAISRKRRRRGSTGDSLAGCAVGWDTVCAWAGSGWLPVLGLAVSFVAAVDSRGR